LKLEDAEESVECIAGLVLQGVRRPYDCPAFGTRCTPDTPLGAPMVSSEGACAAYFHFGRRKDDADSLVSLAVASH
jgi:hydrogenase expression/formation protein HypD